MHTTTTLRHLTLTALAACTLPAALAGPVITGGAETNTDSTYTNGATAGYDFISTTNQYLTALGLWDSGGDGLVAAYEVGVWATATQTLLGTVTISSADALDGSVTVAGGQWRYETLGSAVALSSGATYTVGWYLGAGHNAADSLLINYPTMTVAPTVTIANQCRYDFGPSLAFPTNTIQVTDSYYAMPNAFVSVVPEPGTALLLGAGGLGLLLRRRRK